MGSSLALDPNFLCLQMWGGCPRVGLFSTLIFHLIIYSNRLPRFLAETKHFASMKGHFRFFSALCDLPKEKIGEKSKSFGFLRFSVNEIFGLFEYFLVLWN